MILFVFFFFLENVYCNEMFFFVLYTNDYKVVLFTISARGISSCKKHMARDPLGFIKINSRKKSTICFKVVFITRPTHCTDNFIACGHNDVVVIVAVAVGVMDFVSRDGVLLVVLHKFLEIILPEIIEEEQEDNDHNDDNRDDDDDDNEVDGKMLQDIERFLILFIDFVDVVAVN
ncbi:hypothetical protein FF38_11359 [Lucilia cuprina]|uniref:Uncharacterized protein n=1 Tax=Lucilia cuprina TaxID=7375 RepID=A0A0L0C5K4_LUCCU|nr:hypothetical protein FF38_11359 [Lucilia cuprina]